MKSTFKILFVSSEIAPLAKTGGLADVSGALPKALKTLGHDIRLVMPEYGSIDKDLYGDHIETNFQNIKIKIGTEFKNANIGSTFLRNPEVKTYLIGNDHYYNRQELYRNPETNEDWSDNAERFIFFNKAILEMIRALDWRPDIIHINDWQVSLIPLFLKLHHRNDPFYEGIRTMLTIHNIAYQGLFPKHVLKLMNIDDALFYSGSSIEYWGKVNFLKIGILHSDIITTVSKTYAKEIQQNEDVGFGLQGVLQSRSEDIYGIVNGIDYSIWNPKIDSFIPSNYDATDLSGKSVSKKELTLRNGLKYEPEIPVIGIISRLTDQKGFDLIEEIFDDLMKMNLQFVLLGTGDKKYHDIFESYQKKYPDKTGINLLFDNQLAHLIEAGSDIFLMPSKFEPCGLNQIYSLKYGTIPIVRSVGGLKDTIINFEGKRENGTGFIFKKYSGKELLKTINKAVEVFKDKPVWNKIIQNAMAKEFSWDVSAKHYEKLYRKLLK
ncbi:glycogen synthase GlgA [candidate division KSB1 bacterium]|nr:glycogen synthase GlgA [candidate division KSB1 bacterium]